MISLSKSALENILLSGLIIDLYADDEWFCQLDYFGPATEEYPYIYQLLTAEGTKHLIDLNEIVHYININSVRMEISK